MGAVVASGLASEGVAPPELSVPDRIGPYRIDACLGMGASGSIRVQPRLILPMLRHLALGEGQ